MYILQWIVALPLRKEWFWYICLIFTNNKLTQKNHAIPKQLSSNLDIETMALKSKAVESEIYASLGLDGKQKGVSETPRVVSIISALLLRTINNNEKLLKGSNKKDVVTIFHGLKAPNINIQQYLERIFKYSSCSPSCFVVTYIYIERFVQRTGAYLTSLNVHRLLITSSMVAAKVLDDE